jgi:hypothetical protein
MNFFTIGQHQAQRLIAKLCLVNQYLIPNKKFVVQGGAYQEGS